KDLNTARMLDKKIAQIFEEKQIFRVDHYLGKETVQNILTFRFANGIFEPVWNKNYIDHVQITWAEKKGIEGRGAFFDGVGILRDVAQNHLMQLIASVAMEQPKSFSKEAVRDVRADAIRAIRCIDPEDVAKLVVRGQYNGYQAEKNVAKNSNTETFTAMKLFIDTPRFENVPFYVRAGKKMPKDEVLISIVFIQTCHILFKEYGCPEEGNVLTIRIQPDEGIGVRFIAKKPGAKLSLGTVDMKFSYQDEFDGKGADAYEKVLLDIFAGDQMLFNRSDELESSWEFITKILEGWKSQKLEVRSYEPGTWGPKDAEELIKKDGRKWL
ncbi:MAG: glucose-6-phosphate dehydrogenase, partial [Candidatus Levybacteria bacterium]|nr:glucose-6-phosphate dehydrogenase [Candidatus Levybacteria bacterium]